MASQIDINLSAEVLQHWQTAKKVVSQSFNSITNSAQQFSQSLKETANTRTDQALDTVTTTLEKAKSAVEQTWQTAVTSSLNDWLTEHSEFLHLFHILEWAVNHPIISLIILILGMTLILNIIKVIISLITKASWSILQIPLKLIWAVIKLSFISLTKFRGFAIKPGTDNKTTNKLAVLSTNPRSIDENKNQRLAEISSRLETIQQEQQELLQEAADLIATEIGLTQNHEQTNHKEREGHVREASPLGRSQEGCRELLRKS
ncbi:hypothetical protein [Nodularia sp. NIES-3585]|uniref:hypothetical protein n=1 Tax=Nodularia sp. NIES-3585 TaxID=1973477 RepID=UPI000B6903C5|nr:hypothetical protein [Nodularia sp. NIES-3585]GAX37594.1 hypothetical protein NIES3585_36390 [Nodularia sp. NIES-3585]